VVRGFRVALGVGEGCFVGLVDGVGVAVADGVVVGAVDDVGNGVWLGAGAAVASTTGVQPDDAVVDGDAGPAAGVASPEIHEPWIDPQPASSTAPAVRATAVVAARLLLLRPISPAPSRAGCTTGATSRRDASGPRHATRRS
jgi:hypothetical protein